MGTAIVIRRLLIANRGEIACRIVRTARSLGIFTVAVYSDADAEALHVTAADAALRVGPPPARESYLSIDAVVDAAHRARVDAVHPGYGFLAENAAFAQACADAGLLFVGPPPEAMRAMGDKAAAKALMADAGVPLVPGYHGAAQDPRALRRALESVGLPALIKAAAGGGGKGMRVVRAGDDADAAIDGAKREALSAFGDDRVLIERYLERPRHVEVQVFADRHGNCLHLFERDCSLQRRHQKVVEEAPAPGVDAGLRARMGAAAVAAARSIGYVGAGTVEFLLSPDGAFYFMEMNTRLQVEHPVTEAITGLDLVEWQLRVAEGAPLPLAQEAVALRGHAVEARLYAEDPARGYLPSTGRLTRVVWPDGNGVRVDAGVREGDTVTPFYDPMLAKLIACGADRAQALRRLDAALARTLIAGVTTNRDLLRAAIRLPAFVAGEMDTGLLERTGDALAPQPAGDAALVLAALRLLGDADIGVRVQSHGDPFSPFAQADGWRLNGVATDRIEMLLAGALRRVEVSGGGRRLAVTVDGREHAVERLPDANDRLRALIDGVAYAAAVARADAALTVITADATTRIQVVDPLAQADAAPGADGRLTAQIPGKVTAVHVAPGDAVARGQALVVLEAMKMELTVTAPAAGTVAQLACTLGDQVEEGTLLAVIAADRAPP